MKFSTFLTLIFGVITTQVCITKARLVLIIVLYDIEYNATHRIGGMLKDGPSINFKLENWPLESRTDSHKSGGEFSILEECNGAENELEILKDTVERAVKWVETHVTKIVGIDGQVGLQVLEGELDRILVKKMAHFNATLLSRVRPLIEQIDMQAISILNDEATKQAGKIITKQRDIFTREFSEWKSPDILVERRSDFRNVGEGTETAWHVLNTQCMAALLNECEVPYSCERTYLNLELQSQYMLTHQALYLLFAKKKNCVAIRPDIFGNLENSLESQCGKMLLEAELLAQKGFPVWGRDLFAEYVFICGQAGYPNFLRSDWTREILSWQSRSEYGCFLNPGLKDYSISDTHFLREETELEKELGIKSEEICYAHLSATSLSALAMRLGWLVDHCVE